MASGSLLTGPVIWNVDMGPGRLAKCDGNTGKWEKWAASMHDAGVIMNGLLPNSTQVTAIMDELYGAFKGAIHTNTLMAFARRIKEKALLVQQKKTEIKA